MGTSRKTLLVRHLPEELEDDEKIDFLSHFGAKRVKLMGTTGPMKHTAFAMFENPQAAEKCLKTLHQIELLGCNLILEYAKTDSEKELEVTATPKKAESSEDQTVTVTKPDKDKDKPNESDDKLFHKYGMNYPRKAHLYYLYPPPTASVLTNIGNTLASNPRFYTQVLHLMNKMNLPCPFGAVTAAPPLALDAAKSRDDSRKPHGIDLQSEDIAEYEMEQSSTEESEIESDPESRRNETSQPQNPSRKIRKRPRKRMRLVEPDVSMLTKPGTSINPSEVFENREALKQTQIVFNISAKDAMEQGQSMVESNTLPNTPSTTVMSDITVVEGGFGKVLPQVKLKEAEDIIKEAVNYEIKPEEFLSKDQVRSGRLTSDQIKEFSVFKNYSAGEPTCRLYIKNLTKHTTAQDLVNLFGSYIDWSAGDVNESLDIRLMKEGRMKGQAFVTLPDEKSARHIVAECTGFVMQGKPLVIQFARSAKAKEVKELIK